MKKIILILSIVIVTTAISTVFYSCSDDLFEIDSSKKSLNEMELMTQSEEFEDYIMAGIDFHQSLKSLEIELAKVNFATLEPVIENGRKIIRLPEAINSLDIDMKVKFMNEKKKALRDEYPQLSSLKRKDFRNYVNACIKQSVRVNEYCLNKGINMFQPVLKATIYEAVFNNKSDLSNYLCNWVESEHFKEVTVLTYTDGTCQMFLDDRNTSERAFLDDLTYQTGAGRIYYKGKEINGVAHTHGYGNNGHNPSDDDYLNKANWGQYPYVDHYVWYDGYFNQY